MLNHLMMEIVMADDILDCGGNEIVVKHPYAIKISKNNSNVVSIVIQCSIDIENQIHKMIKNNNEYLVTNLENIKIIGN